MGLDGDQVISGAGEGTGDSGVRSSVRGLCLLVKRASGRLCRFSGLTDCSEKGECGCEGSGGLSFLLVPSFFCFKM